MLSPLRRLFNSVGAWLTKKRIAWDSPFLIDGARLVLVDVVCLGVAAALLEEPVLRLLDVTMIG